MNKATTIEEYFEQNCGSSSLGFVLMPIAEVGEITLSIQASSGHYCSPRDNSGPWVKYEVGFPSERITCFMPYAEDPESPTKTVYGYVPGVIINEFIARNGGFISRRDTQS